MNYKLIKLLNEISNTKDLKEIEYINSFLSYQQNKIKKEIIDKYTKSFNQNVKKEIKELKKIGFKDYELKSIYNEISNHNKEVEEIVNQIKYIKTMNNLINELYN